MITPAFEIKVALLGYVSVGKTTVLNALFQDKYSETTMRRTTAGINFFRISAPNSGAKRKNDGAGNSKRAGNESRSKRIKEMEWTAATEELRSPTSTLQEITADNVVLREKNEIQEKFFDIALDDHLCEMRKDTKLVIVDIPGVNEAGSKKLYMDYVNTKWDSFDCVVVVLDAKQGANTEEQVHLLELVKKNNADKKDLPVIILCNKVDDPEEEEMKVLLDEVQATVEKIFEVDCRKAALTKALHLQKQRDRVLRYGNWMWPSLIPISAGHAFLYRRVCRLKLEDFKKLHADFIEKLGRDEVGRMKWKKLSQAEKYEAAYSSVSNELEYKERLEATQFDKFLDILALSCGGEARQQEILQKQIHVSMKNLSWKGNVADQLLSVYERSKAVGKPTITLNQTFWSEYEKHCRQAFSYFSDDMSISGLHGAMDQLHDYFDRFIPTVYTDNATLFSSEKERVIASMVGLVRIQCGKILEKESEWNVTQSNMMVGSASYQPYGTGQWRNTTTGSMHYGDAPPESPHNWIKERHGWKNKYTQSVVQCECNPGYGKVNWKLLSPHDWFTIIRSLLLLTYHKHFCEKFGREIVMLERTIWHGNAAKALTVNSATASKMNENIRGSYSNGVFKPANEASYGMVMQITVPEQLSNPEHWGHLAWKFCEFMNKMQS